MLKRKEHYDYKDKYNFKEANNRKQNSHKKNNSRIHLPFCILCILVLGVLAVTYIGQTVKITHLNYKIDNLETTLEKLKDNNQQLKLNAAQKTSLTNIEKIARNKLNMVEPTKTEILVINNKTSQKTNSPMKKQSNIVIALNNLINKLRTVKADSP